MQNKKLILLAILGILAIFSLIYGIVTPARTRRPPQAKESDIQPERKTSLTEKPILIQRVTKKTNYTSWSRDPFQKISPKAFKSLILGGIMWDNEKSMAIINGETVKVGDKIDDNLVVAIKQKSVILNDGSKDFELRLSE